MTISPSAEPQRLAKAVAALVPCSRREAEQYIVEGWVRVDGQRVDVPQARVRADQRIELDPQAHLPSQAPVTLLYNQTPNSGVTDLPTQLWAATQWTGDTSGLEPSPLHRRGLQQLMPLPPAASGLCVLSQDVRVIRKLTEDAVGVEQELIAEVKGSMQPDGLSRLCHGLQHNGQALPPARVSWQNETRLRFAAKGIAPGWIAGMCADVGLELVGLKRLRLGRVAMAGLAPGQWRYLLPEERF